MKCNNSRLLFTAFTLIGLSVFSFGQSESTYQQDGTEPGTYTPIPDQARMKGAIQPTPEDGALPADAPAASSPWNLDTSGATRITVNETPVEFSDAQPGMIDGLLMVPVRAFAEQTGATVHWNNDAKEVEIDLPNQPPMTLSAIRQPSDIPMGSDEDPTVSGPEANMSPLSQLGSDQVVIIDDHAYMPVDQLATAFDGTENWDQGEGTATITVPTISPGTTSVDETPVGTSGTDENAGEPVNPPPSRDDSDYPKGDNDSDSP